MKIDLLAAPLLALLALPCAARASSFTALYNFTAASKHAPVYPAGRLTHIGGALYGVTESDGSCPGYECGTIYRYNLSRSTVETRHLFTGAPDGGFPVAGLVGANGFYYGTTLSGGNSGAQRAGTIYQFDPSTKVETPVYSFPADPSGSVYYYPNELIARGTTLYGTMASGIERGRETGGALFAFDVTSAQLTNLHEFATKLNSSDGELPCGSPVFVGQSLYGLTTRGGTAGLGTVYKYNFVSGKEKIVHNFADVTGNGNQPADHLVKLAGLLYGVTSFGGPGEGGTLFDFDPLTAAFKVVYTFGNIGGDGTRPQFAPVYSNGALYGTTSQGGASGNGTIYRFDPSSGTETVIYSFPGGAGGSSPADLLNVKNVLYGTTFNGGTSNMGLLYKLAP